LKQTELIVLDMGQLPQQFSTATTGPPAHSYVCTAYCIKTVKQPEMKQCS